MMKFFSVYLYLFVYMGVNDLYAATKSRSGCLSKAEGRLGHYESPTSKSLATHLRRVGFHGEEGVFYHSGGLRINVVGQGKEAKFKFYLDGEDVSVKEISGFADFPRLWINKLTPQGTAHFLFDHFSTEGLRVSYSGGENPAYVLESQWLKLTLYPKKFRENQFYPMLDAHRVVLKEDLSDIPDSVLGIEYPAKEKVLNSRFTIGGDNTDTAIRSLFKNKGRESPRINGLTLKQIQYIMRPGRGVPSDAVTFHDRYSLADYSDDGFIGEKEALEDVLLTQNQEAHSRGLTHQEIAMPLYRIMGALRNGFLTKDVPYIYQGTKIKVRARHAGMGNLYSPIVDGFATRSYMYVENLDNGNNLSYSALLPRLIWQLGFYESNTRMHHRGVEKILETFPFLKKKKK